MPVRYSKHSAGPATRQKEPAVQIEVKPGVLPVDDPVYAKQDDPNENYYKDIVTTGAAADLAEKLGVDLSEVTGTGLHGKITKADVEAAAA